MSPEYETIKQNAVISLTNDECIDLAKYLIGNCISFDERVAFENWVLDEMINFEDAKESLIEAAKDLKREINNPEESLIRDKKRPICKGSIALGTGCRRCYKCIEELKSV